MLGKPLRIQRSFDDEWLGVIVIGEKHKLCGNLAAFHWCSAHACPLLDEAVRTIY